MLIYSLSVCFLILAFLSVAFLASLVTVALKFEYSFSKNKEDYPYSFVPERVAYLCWMAFFACSWWYTYAYLEVEKEEHIATFYNSYVKLDKGGKTYDLSEIHSARLRKKGYFLGDTVYYTKHGTKFLIMFNDQDGVYNKYQE